MNDDELLDISLLLGIVEETKPLRDHTDIVIGGEYNLVEAMYEEFYTQKLWPSGSLIRCIGYIIDFSNYGERTMIYKFELVDEYYSRISIEECYVVDSVVTHSSHKDIPQDFKLLVNG
jgi:hypothetical protein